jgi:hypothetical protein
LPAGKSTADGGVVDVFHQRRSLEDVHEYPRPHFNVRELWFADASPSK